MYFTVPGFTALMNVKGMIVSKIMVTIMCYARQSGSRGLGQQLPRDRDQLQRG